MRNQILLENRMGQKQCGREQPVEHRRLPLDEGLVLKNECRAAEDDDNDKTHPKHGVDFPVAKPYPADLSERGGDRDRRSGVNAIDLERCEKQDDREEIEKKFHRIARCVCAIVY